MVKSTQIIQADGAQSGHTISLILLKASSRMFEFRSQELLPWARVLTLLSATGSFVVSNMVTVVSKFHLLRREREKEPTLSTCLVVLGVLEHFPTKEKKESEAAQSCLTLCDSMDCSPSGSSIHGIFQARVLE